MRQPRFFGMILLLSATACGDDDSNGLGDRGRLRFETDDSSCSSCDTRQPIALGGGALIKVSGDDPAGGYLARATGPQVAVEHEDLACICTETFEGGSFGASIGPEESCLAPATRHCDRLVFVRGVTEGETLLEMLGPSNEVIDSISLSVARPVRVEPVVGAVRLTGGTVNTIPRTSDGSFTVDAPIQLIFSATAFDATGRELHAKNGDFEIDSEDLSLEDWTAGERSFKFERAAEATLTARGFGLETAFAIHVVAR